MIISYNTRRKIKILDAVISRENKSRQTKDRQCNFLLKKISFTPAEKIRFESELQK